jgi:nucleoside 2-deoxyribosyltransferase
LRYYIATKLENHAQHNKVRDVLNAMGHQITYDWTSHGPVWTSGIGRIREVSILETNGVLDADVVVILWPGGRGTHVELGMAIAARKPVIFMSTNLEHHIASPETCAFYHHPLVDKCKSVDEIPRAMYFAECKVTGTDEERLGKRS